MGLTRVEDCAACEMEPDCDAWHPGGTWHHREGPNPCDLTIQERIGSGDIKPPFFV